MPKQIWDIWPELTAKVNGTLYIQTPDEKWADYLSVWRRAVKEDYNTSCPCPLPEGHLSFAGVKAPPKKSQKQMELF